MCAINLDYRNLFSCPCCGDVNEAAMIIGDGTMLSHFWEFCNILFEERPTSGEKLAVDNGTMSFMSTWLLNKHLRRLKAAFGYTVNKREVLVTEEVCLYTHVFRLLSLSFVI